MQIYLWDKDQLPALFKQVISMSLLHSLSLENRKYLLDEDPDSELETKEFTNDIESVLHVGMSHATFFCITTMV